MTRAGTSLDQLIDVHEIQQLLHRYAAAVDTIDLDLFDQCFAADARIHLSDRLYESRDAYKRQCRDVLPKLDATQHCMMNCSIRVDGATATARTYFVAQHVRNELAPEPFFLTAGWNDDELARGEAGWLIERRRGHRAWWTGNPAVIWLDMPKGGHRPVEDGRWPALEAN